MRCPSLNELPPPPSGKSGWPWTLDSPRLPERAPDGRPWPRVSIVTPSCNQGRFIEETVRSVLLQGYPDIEYIVIDGASTDGTIDIISKYEAWLSYWVSEKDAGQSHAINKGFDRATGEVFGYLNSDDYFLPGGLLRLLTFRQDHLDAVAWAGACNEVDVDGEPLRRFNPRVGDKAEIGHWGKGAYFAQPSCLFSAASFREVGGVDERLSYALDVDLWLKLADKGDFASLNQVVSCARTYPQAKSARNIPLRDAEVIAAGVFNGVPESAMKKLLDFADLQVHPFRERALAYDRIQQSYHDLLRHFIQRTAQGVRNRIFGRNRTP